MKLAMMALVAALGVAGPAVAQTADPASTAAWAQEQRYWADAQAGNFTDFLTLFSDRFQGWSCDVGALETKADLHPPPPGVTVTATLDRERAVSAPGMVVTSYRAVQTASMNAAKQDTRTLDFTHVWVSEPSGWKLIAGMCRDAPGD